MHVEKLVMTECKGWSVLVTAAQVVSLLMTAVFLDTYFTSADATSKQNYVKPVRGIPHLTDQERFLTLEDYAGQQHQYFVNDTIFYLYPGIHTLNRSLYVTNVHNLTIQGLSDNEPAIVALGSLVSIIWKNCLCITISSVDFNLAENFTRSIVFELTRSVQLSRVSVFGNGNSGCSSISSQGSTIDISDSSFVGIKGLIGSALIISDSSVVTFTGYNRFENNEANVGGAIFLRRSMLSFSGKSLLINNMASRLNANIMIDTLCNLLWNEIDTQLYGFVQFSGGAIFSVNSTLTINNNSSFIQNIARTSGGSISAVNGNMTIRGSVLFDRNYADIGGGAIDLNNTNSEFNTNGTVSFLNNVANSGGAIRVIFGNILFMGKTTSTDSHNFMDASQRKVDSGDDIIIFHKNTANRTGGAILFSYSNVVVSGTLCFELNVARFGGAIATDAISTLILTPVLVISFIMNSAYDSGGALYIDNGYYECFFSSRSSSPSECFFSIGNTYSNTVNISLSFVNNSAHTGSTLFGGELNKCKVCYETIKTINSAENRNCSYYSDDAFPIFMKISSIFLHKDSVNNISSPPQTLHFCQSDVYVWNLDVYPGQEVNVTLKAKGQTSSLVPANLLCFSNSEYTVSPKHQQIGSSCTDASFRLYSDKDEDIKHDGVSVNLYFNNDCWHLDFSYPKLRLRINVLPCPLGFALSKEHKICACERVLSKFVQSCYIDSLSIERMENNFWVSKESNTTIILHEFRCPLDYCKVNPVNVTLDKSDEQCDFNRNGILCGRCLKHYSLALGSFHCLSCSNKHIALILPFALAGILLVALILLLRLTVAVGTLNGLLFYANVIQANHQAFFPRATTNIFTIFTSWLNLDLGIETCFYDGMDTYVYSWLQFLFPFYVWFLIGCIILVSHYSQFFARNLGQNPVAVLATLLLISFSKILGAIITPLSWTYLKYYYNSTHETHRIVWLYDGSLDFFKGPKHTALGVFVILILILFILPYVFLLTFAQWLQACSNWCVLSWLNNLKPLIDVYHAPYKRHARYRTGLLLLTRLGLFLTFAVNTLGSANINILAVSSATIVLLGMQVGSVYEHWWNDLLECSFLINLGIFSAVTFYIKEEIKHDKHDQSQLILSSISVGAAFATFFGILLFHTYFVIKSTSFWKVHNIMYPHNIIHKNQLLARMLRTTEEKENDATLQESTGTLAIPTSTTVDVDLREPLIDTTFH